MYFICFFCFKQWQNFIFLNQDYCFKLECTFYLSVNVFSSKVPTEGNIGMSPIGWGHNFTCWLSSEPCKDLAICKEKEVPSILNYFKTLSIGPLLGIEPTPSQSAVKLSTDWVNPARTVAIAVDNYCLIFPYVCIFNWRASDCVCI